MAERKETSEQSDKIAEAIVNDLADPNHIFWNAGTPGLARNPWDRFDGRLKTQMLQRFSRVINDAL
jgi:hypothetical protein